MNQVNEKLNEQQLAYLSSPKAVKEFLEINKENITHMIKQSLAVGDIFKRENLQVHLFPSFFSNICTRCGITFEILGFVLQYSTEELVKEVNNSIAEFEKHKQDYDEERVKVQVRTKKKKEEKINLVFSVRMNLKKYYVLDICSSLETMGRYKSCLKEQKF